MSPRPFIINYSGTSVCKLNLFYDFRKDGYICVHVEEMAVVVFVT